MGEETQLDRIEQLARDAKIASEITNGRVLRLEEIFHGPADRTGRHTGRGLLHHVEEIEGRVVVIDKQISGVAVGAKTSHQNRTTWIMGLALIVSGLSAGVMLLGLVLG